MATNERYPQVALSGWCLLLLLSGLAGSGCGRPRQAGSDPGFDPLFDPQLTALDAAAPTTRFDGGGGSLLLGEGWAPPQDDHPQGTEVVPTAWAVGEEATIWVERPPVSPVDFRANCRPLTFDGAPQQTVTLAAGARTLGVLALADGWQELRLPLPADALEPGLNRLRLTFAYARKPKEVLPGSEDPRRLAVACQYLALVPRLVSDGGFPHAALDERTRTLRLPPGAHATFPLPAASAVSLRLGRVSSGCRRCRLRVGLLGAGGEESLWQGKAARASGLSVPFSTAEQGLSRLRLAWVGAGDSPVTVQLPPGFLEITRPSRAPARRPVHVFVYLIDTLRADSLSPERRTSPQIAAFARDGVTYRNAWSASSWTLPAVVSILTGTYPFRHGVMRGNTRFSGDVVPSLATLLAAAGYDTLGISQSYVASARFGIDAGFDRFYLSDQLNGRLSRSQEIRRYLLAGLLERRESRRPLFAYVHTVAPHSPYAPTGENRRFERETPGTLAAENYLPSLFLTQDFGDDPREVAHLRALYDGEVAYADRELGRFVALLRHLDLYDDSLIVLLSDHGEEFGEHGGFDHGRTLYEELLRIPLIIKYPHSQGAGRMIAERVSVVDVLPTILKAAGVATDGLAFDGTSILPADLDSRPPSRRMVFAEVNPMRSRILEPVDYRAVVLDDLKCIESLTGRDQFGREIPRWQTFDLGRDPRERLPLNPDAPGSERCRGLLQGWLGARQHQRGESQPAVDAEALDQLRALGYID